MSTDQLVTFLYGITAHTKLTKASIINAYIRAHASFNVLTSADTSDKLQDELIQRSNAEIEDTEKTVSKAPTFESLFDVGDIVEGG